MSNRRALDGRKVELDGRRVVGMLSLKLSLDLDRSGEQRRIRRGSERRQHERRQQMVQGEIGVSVKLLAEFRHAVEPILNAISRCNFRTVNSALNALSQLQVGQEHTVEREKLEDRFPTKCGTVRLRGVNLDKDMTGGAGGRREADVVGSEIECGRRRGIDGT